MNVNQMLLEATQDAVAALKLLRLGAETNAPMSAALNMVNLTIDELEYAISYALDKKEAA